MQMNAAEIIRNFIFYQIDSDIIEIMHFRNSYFVNNAMITNKVIKLTNTVLWKYQLNCKYIKKVCSNLGKQFNSLLYA